VAVGGIVFVLVLLDFSLRYGRTALAIGFASGFFDLQGRAFLDGRLSVPDGSLGIEGFETGGHTFLYFGPWPALLRLPVLMSTDDFDDRLTVASMALAWLVFAVMFVKLVWLARRLILPERPVSRTDAALAALLIAAGTGGTTLTFDASLPWAYHEVYLWQSAFVIGAAYWMVRVVLDPDPRAIRWLGAFALGAALTRTTGGWAVSLTVIGIAIWLRWGRSFVGRRERWGWVLVAGAVPLAVAIAYNYVRFRHPYMFPLQDQVWTRLNEHRREALEVNGGSITGLQFFWTSLVNYFSPTGVRIVDYFPWITLPAEPAKAYRGAFLDQSFRTGSVTAFMPLLCLLSLLGLVRLLRPTPAGPAGLGLRALRPPAIATVLMTAGVMAYGYVATRYTSEFVPGLLVLGTVGTWTLGSALRRVGRGPRVAVLGVVTIGVAWSLVAWTAVGFATSAFTYRGDRLERYLTLQSALSGGPDSPMSRLVRTGDHLPTGAAPADTLYIRGQCDGLYVATGDSYEPWTVVEERAHVVKVSFPEDLPTRTVMLFTVRGVQETRTVRLQVEREGQARVVVVDSNGTYAGNYFEITPDSSVRIGLRTDGALAYLEVSSTPGGFVGYVPVAEWSDDWVSEFSTVTSRYLVPTDVDGLQVRPEKGLTPTLCARLVADQELDLD